jgi:hypothetical protein
MKGLARVRWFTRTCGLSAILGGLLIVAARVFQVALFGDLPLSQQAFSRSFIPLVGVPGFSGGLFLLLGAVGLYLQQSDRYPGLGFASFVLAFLGLSLSNAANWLYAFGSPLLRQLDPTLLDLDFGDPRWGPLGPALVIAYLAGGAGWLILGLHTLIAGRLPRWVPLTMIICMTLAAVVPLGTTGAQGIIVNVLIAAGPIAFGYALWADKATEANRSA